MLEEYFYIGFWSLKDLTVSIPGGKIQPALKMAGSNSPRWDLNN